MSHGLGKIEREILSVFSENDSPHFDIDPFNLAGLVFDVRPDDDGLYRISRAQAGSVRRALSSLQKKGLVFKAYNGVGGRTRWKERSEAMRYMEQVDKAFGLKGEPKLLVAAYVDWKVSLRLNAEDNT